MKKIIFLFVLLPLSQLFSQGFATQLSQSEYLVQAITLQDHSVYTAGLNMSGGGGLTVFKFDPAGDTTTLIHLSDYSINETDIRILPDSTLLVFAQYVPIPNGEHIQLIKMEMDGTVIDSVSLESYTDNNNHFTPIIDEGFIYFIIHDTGYTNNQCIIKMDFDLNLIYRMPAPAGQVHVGHRSLEIAPNNDLYIFTGYDSSGAELLIHHFDNDGNFLNSLSFPSIDGFPTTEETQFLFSDSIAVFHHPVPFTMGDNHRFNLNLNTGAVTDINTGGFFMHNLIPFPNNRFLCTIRQEIANYGNGYTYLAIIDENFNILNYNVILGYPQYINHMDYEDNSIALSFNSQYSNTFYVAEFDTSLSPIFGNIHGEIDNDLDNSCDDISGTDIAINNSIITAHSNFYDEYSFPINGSYGMFVAEDTYDVTSSTPDGFNDNCPNSYNINVTAGDSFHLDFFKDQLDFDLSLNSYSNGFIAPLQSGSLNIFISNPGQNNISSSTLRLVNDSLVTYVSASIVPDLVTGDTLIWNLGNMDPDSINNILVNYSLAPSIIAGTHLTFTSSIQSILPTDLSSGNNFDTLETVVVNSYDPNDKTVNPPGISSYGIISRYQELEYMVRFQNTGNYPAKDIFIIDPLDGHLDLSTLEIVSASHPYEVRLTSGDLRLDFKNIYLADSNSNEPASHGYFIYRIKPKANVAQGSTILNTANIYFDFNLPILTNQTFNTIESPMGIDPANTATVGCLYPNPASESITLVFPSDNHGDKNIVVSIQDMQGRIVQQHNMPAAINLVIDISALPNGIYIAVADNIIYKFVKR